MKGWRCWCLYAHLCGDWWGKCGGNDQEATVANLLYIIKPEHINTIGFDIFHSIFWSPIIILPSKWFTDVVLLLLWRQNSPLEFKNHWWRVPAWSDNDKNVRCGIVHNLIMVPLPAAASSRLDTDWIWFTTCLASAKNCSNGKVWSMTTTTYRIEKGKSRNHIFSVSHLFPASLFAVNRVPIKKRGERWCREMEENRSNRLDRKSHHRDMNAKTNDVSSDSPTLNSNYIGGFSRGSVSLGFKLDDS